MERFARLKDAARRKGNDIDAYIDVIPANARIHDTDIDVIPAKAGIHDTNVDVIPAKAGIHDTDVDVIPAKAGIHWGSSQSKDELPRQQQQRHEATQLN